MAHAAFRGKWWIGHVIVVVLAVTFVGLGIWQLQRLHDRRANNAVEAERLASAPVPIEELVPLGATVAPSAVVNRPVTVTGAYEPDREVLIRGRSSARDESGFWDVMPLRLADGRAVVVVRGWIPFAAGDTRTRPVPGVLPPAGPVTVQGIVRSPERRGAFGAVDPADGVLVEMARVDVARLDQQIPGDVLPVWVALGAQTPPNPVGSPVPLRKPSIDDGPHLNYAIQWFMFATIAVVGWAILVRQSTRKRGRSSPRPPSTPAETPDTGSIEDSPADAGAPSGA